MKLMSCYLVIICLLNIGCNNSIEARIAERAKNCPVNPCKINLNDFTEYKWDTLYAFNYGTSPELIQELIKQPYNGYQIGTRPMIFTYKHQIVYSENNEWDSEGFIQDQVFFSFPDSLRCKIYTPDNAQFTIKREKAFGHDYFSMNR